LGLAGLAQVLLGGKAAGTRDASPTYLFWPITRRRRYI